MFKKILVVILVMGLFLPVGVVMAGNGPGGPGGGGGGEGDIPDIGELYGDLYVILRDVNGVPILSADGCIQPISGVTSSTTIVTQDGDLLIEVFEGEPFALPTYTDTAGDLVECELTEDMATWVQAVDFGRLNLGRAPEGVIAHAFDEAINKLNSAVAVNVDPVGRVMYTLDNIIWSTIDAPAENLALYIKLMTDGHWITVNTDPTVKGGKPEGKGPPEGDGPSTEPRPVLNCYNEDGTESQLHLDLDNLGFVNLCHDDEDTALENDELVLAASLLAGAADKGGTITLDKVVYINSIYGINKNDTSGYQYYNFSNFGYGPQDDRARIFGGRKSDPCVPGFTWVLQPDDDTYINFTAGCVEILTSVMFNDMSEIYDTVDPDYVVFDSNVRGFTQAADDALQVIEYIHNYKVPVVLYP